VAKAGCGVNGCEKIIILVQVCGGRGHGRWSSAHVHIDESSELSEVSVFGPADAQSDMDSVSAGDSAEWEDVV
jgi:hypothetical protein